MALPYVEYGYKGDASGGQLFRKKCQTKSCVDGDGDNGWWFLWGYSYALENDIKPSQKVLHDVKTVSYNHYSTDCGQGYTNVGHWDSTGGRSVGTDGKHGHWTYNICVKYKRWRNVKRKSHSFISKIFVQSAYTRSRTKEFGKSETIGKWYCDEMWMGQFERDP